MSTEGPPRMTPQQLALTPAGAPPDGIQYNLVNPHTEAKYIIIILGAFFVAIMFFFAGIRYHMKFVVQRKSTADDVTTFIAIIGTCWYYGTCCYAVTLGKYGIHMWDISIAHTMSNDFLIVQAGLFVNIISSPVWALIKTSFFLMYLQLFNPLAWVRWCCYVGIFVCWGFYMPIFIATVYYQAPGVGQTWQEGFMNARYFNIQNLTMPIASGNLILDVYIFIIPLIVTWNLHLSKSKKLGLLAVFATGSIAVASSVLSIVFKVILNAHDTDYTYWVYPTLLLCITEMTLGIACSCMPSTAGFFRRADSGNDSGNRSTSWSSNVFGLRSLRNKYGKSRSSQPSNSANSGFKVKEDKPLKQIVADTYSTLGNEFGSTHELTSVASGPSKRGGSSDTGGY